MDSAVNWDNDLKNEGYSFKLVLSPYSTCPSKCLTYMGTEEVWILRARENSSFSKVETPHIKEEKKKLFFRR